MPVWLVIYALWAIHGLVTFMWANWPAFAAKLRTNEQEWIPYLQ